MAFYYTPYPFATSSLLFRSGNLCCCSVEKLYKLAEAGDLNALVIAVDASNVFWTHDRSNVICLNAPGAKLGRVCGPDLHDGNRRHAGKDFLLGMLQGMEGVGIQTGGWRRRALVYIFGVDNGNSRIIEQLGQLGFEGVHVLI